jgi:CDP-glucose 4,6-dehydratase
VALRYPDSVRPWQHVLEPLRGYLTLAEHMVARRGGVPEAVNFGPDPANAMPVSRVVELLAGVFDGALRWERAVGSHPPEAAVLTLDSTLAGRALGWTPRLGIDQTIGWTAEWYRGWRDGADARRLTLDQIARYEALCEQASRVTS